MGKKNPALPCIAACLLTDEPVELSNVPDIADVRAMLKLVETAGMRVLRLDENRISLHREGEFATVLPDELTSKIRASILGAGPLLARTGRVTMGPPGGDVIGRRRLDTHFRAFEALGADISMGEQMELTGRSTAPYLRGTEIWLEEASVTATENALMAATLASGRTVIWNAASEPHVQDLALLLTEMGASISGAGTNRLIVEGVERLHGTHHRIRPDHVEIGSFIGLAAITGGDLTIHDVVPKDLRMILQLFNRIGIRTVLSEKNLHVAGGQDLAVRYDLRGSIPQVEDGPWPAFPSDLMSIALVVATQAAGTVLFFEKMFESRMYFVDSLIGMGARIVLCDPHRAVVVGKAPLAGGRVVSPDIRAGMALLLAACAAEGTTTIHNISQIDRGYERIDAKIRALGGTIERRQGDS